MKFLILGLFFVGSYSLAVETNDCKRNIYDSPTFPQELKERMKNSCERLRKLDKAYAAIQEDFDAIKCEEQPQPPRTKRILPGTGRTGHSTPTIPPKCDSSALNDQMQALAPEQKAALEEFMAIQNEYRRISTPPPKIKPPASGR
ncbi:MAG: hypothetical protein AABY64_08380 [Bdellovibrionota bacterium]